MLTASQSMKLWRQTTLIINLLSKWKWNPNLPAVLTFLLAYFHPLLTFYSNLIIFFWLLEDNFVDECLVFHFYQNQTVSGGFLLFVEEAKQDNKAPTSHRLIRDADEMPLITSLSVFRRFTLKPSLFICKNNEKVITILFT